MTGRADRATPGRQDDPSGSRVGAPEQTRSERRRSLRHAPTRGDMKQQLRRHGPSRPDPRQSVASAFTPKCSCPRRAAGLRDGRAVRGSGGEVVAAGCGIPTTSRRATTRQPRGRAARGTVRVRRGLPPGRRVVGRCQVDGMPHQPRRGRKCTGRLARTHLISRAPVSD